MAVRGPNTWAAAAAVAGVGAVAEKAGDDVEVGGADGVDVKAEVGPSTGLGGVGWPAKLDAVILGV